MTEEERETARLRSIQSSIARIAEYTRGGRDVFLNENIVQDAVLRRLETLADATERLSVATKSRHPEISWRQVYGFRYIAAHAYEGLDLSRVWEILENYLPSLGLAVEQELSQREPES
jgi:uncharacterized protein with HEPN domain